MVSFSSSMYSACLYQKSLMWHVDFLFKDCDLCCKFTVVVLKQSTPSCCENNFLSHQRKYLFYWLLLYVLKSPKKKKEHWKPSMIIFSARFKGEELLKERLRRGNFEAHPHFQLSNSCGCGNDANTFLEMFLNVAHYNGSSFRKYSLCKLSTVV